MPADAPVLILAEDAALLDDLLRLCAAAAVAPECVGLERARASWMRAPAVIVDARLAPSLAELALPRRERVVVVRRAEPGDAAASAPDEIWRPALALGAQSVVTVPTEQDTLSALLADLVDGAGRGLTVGVVPGVGGAGASTIAAALGLAAVRAGRDALLVDADPLGGGLELLLGCESLDGLRWADLAGTRGRVSAQALRSALPHSTGLPVLSGRGHGAGWPDAATMRMILTAAGRAADLLVVDLPRCLHGAAAEALACCDVLLVVVPGEVRSVAAARALLRAVRDLSGRTLAVVRRSTGSALLPESVADVLGVPLAAVVSRQRGLARTLDDGLGPPRRGALDRAGRELLGLLLPQERAA